MSLRKKIEWRENEAIVEAVKPSPLKFFWHYFLAILILFAMAFFSFWLIRQGVYGTLVIISCVLASFALFFDARRRCNANYWILTTERLIDIERHSILSETVSPVDYDSITDVHVRRRGINARLFGLGDLVADTDSDEFAISLSCVRHPQIVLEWILRLSQGSVDRRAFSDSRLLLKYFYKNLPRFTAADINEIRNRIDNRVNAEDEIIEKL